MKEDKTKIRRTAPKNKPIPLWQEILFAVPKNLVYILIFVVVASFAIMCWIIYTERNLSDFVAYDRSKEVVVINPLFT